MTIAQVINWIDEGWQSPPIRIQGRTSFLAALLPASVVGALAAAEMLPRSVIITIVAICVGWVVLVVWRGLIAAQKSTEKGDREYDKRIKYSLSEEYHQTESASSARKRRKK